MKVCCGVSACTSKLPLRMHVCKVVACCPAGQHLSSQQPAGIVGPGTGRLAPAADPCDAKPCRRSCRQVKHRTRGCDIVPRSTPTA